MSACSASTVASLRQLVRGKTRSERKPYAWTTAILLGAAGLELCGAAQPCRHWWQAVPIASYMNPRRTRSAFYDLHMYCGWAWLLELLWVSGLGLLPRMGSLQHAEKCCSRARGYHAGRHVQLNLR